MKKRFPDMIIHWAYTSSIVRKKLAARGKKKESVIESLEMLARNGFKRIVIQSLHTIAGFLKVLWGFRILLYCTSQMETN